MAIVNSNNYRFYLDQNRNIVTGDENDRIDIRSLNKSIEIRGGNGDDTIYGSTTMPNFLFGDYTWSFPDNEPEQELIYAQTKGNDEIHGGDIFNVIQGGRGNDKLYGGKGINFYIFKAGDSEPIENEEYYDGNDFWSHTADVIYPSGGSDYIYFCDTSFDEMTIWSESQDLIITYPSNDNEHPTSTLVIKDYLKSTSVKGICDKNTDISSITEITHRQYYNANLFVAAMRNALYNITKDLPSITTTAIPNANRTINVSFRNEEIPFHIYSVSGVSSAYRLQIDNEDDFSHFIFYKEGNDLYLEHHKLEYNENTDTYMQSTQDGLVILKNYFIQREGSALDMINGMSFKEYNKEFLQEDTFLPWQNKIDMGEGQKTITGTYLGDYVDTDETNVTINTGKGNDFIKLPDGNNTVTGGEGHNKIFINSWSIGIDDNNENNHIRTNTISLTKNEELEIIMNINSINNIEQAEDFDDLFNIDIQGKDCVISVNHDVESWDMENVINMTDKIIIKNFTSAVAKSIKFKFRTEKYVDSQQQIISSTYDLYDKYWVQEGEPRNGKGVTLNGTALKDEITGTQYADIINAYAEDDIIHGTSGNDTISGGIGKNNIEYTSAFDNDYIKLSNGEDLTIDISAFGISLNNLKNNISVNKANIEITVPNEGKIILANFANSNVVGKGSVVLKYGNNQNDVLNLNDDRYINMGIEDYSSVNLKTGVTTYTGKRLSETIDINQSQQNCFINSNAGNDSIISGSGNDTINAGDGDDTITGGLGNDKLTGGKGVNTFVFDTNTANGLDTITDIKAGDKIQLLNPGPLSYNRIGKNLEIIYHGDDDNNKIIVQNYFAKTPSVDVIDENGDNIANLSAIQPIIRGQGIINGTTGNDMIVGSYTKDTIKGISGNDTLFGGSGDDIMYGGSTADSKTTFVLVSGHDKDTIYSGKGQDKLLFMDLPDQEALNGVSFKVVGKDLQILYSQNDSVTLKNYYGIKPAHSVDRIVALNGDELLLSDIAPLADGSKRYTINSEDYNLEVGNTNSNITFTGDFGNNLISSNGNNFTDRLVFKDYSISDDNMYIGYGYNYNELTDESEIENDLYIGLYDDPNDIYMGPWGDKKVLYSNYFTTNTHNLIIEDKYRSYNVEKFNNVMNNMNLSSGKYLKQNNILFLHGESETAVNKVTSNTGYNFINSYGAALNYTYKGGIDDVNSESDDTNDIYNISVFNNKTDICVTDGGGNDIININTLSDNLRLYFSVWDDEEPGINYSREEITILHKSSMNANNIYNLFYGDGITPERCGIIDIEAQSDNYSQGAAGIEKYTTTDYKNGLDMQTWINVIKSRVAEWNDNHPGALENIMNGNIPEDFNSLIACYDISYKQAMTINNLNNSNMQA